MRWWVYVPARRLALPAEMPRLDVDGAIERGWHLSLRIASFPKCWLLLPDPPVFLPTRPVSPGYLRGYRFTFEQLAGPRMPQLP